MVGEGKTPLFKHSYPLLWFLHPDSCETGPKDIITAPHGPDHTNSLNE